MQNKPTRFYAFLSIGVAILTMAAFQLKHLVVIAIIFILN